MSLQMRLPKDMDARVYNPNRDVAHCLVSVIIEIAGRLDDARWPELHRYLKSTDTTDDNLCAAAEAFIKFTQTLLDKRDTMAEALQRSGWDDVPEPAKVAYMAYLGTVMAGVFYHGVKEATFGGEGPVSANSGNMQALTDAGLEMKRIMALPRWRRWLRRNWRKLFRRRST